MGYVSLVGRCPDVDWCQQAAQMERLTQHVTPLPRHLAHGSLRLLIQISYLASTISDCKLSTAMANQRDQILAGATAVMGGRPEMEDAVTVQPNLCSPLINRSLPLHFFAVFDGHGGSHFSNSCKEEMHQILKEELMGESDQIEPPGYVTEKRALLEAWRLLLNRVFARTEKAALSICDCGKDLNCTCKINGTSLLSQMGTTAVALVVTETHLVVGNCGDSRAVLYRSGRPIPLSSDHKPTREDEKARIEACGGNVLHIDGVPRVEGVLAMTRSIGDLYLKPYVTSEAEVSLARRGEEEEFVILASDGLWDVIPHKMAGRVAAHHLRKAVNEDDGCLSAASELTQLALNRGSSDNISVVVVDLTSKARAA